MIQLTEYYKFHRDIARLFMLPITNTLNKYHDKKRRIEYVRITKLIKEENKALGIEDDSNDELNADIIADSDEISDNEKKKN